MPSPHHGRRLRALASLAGELARRRGFEATFMPKPYANLTGNGAHFNMSFASSVHESRIHLDRGEGLSVPQSKASARRRRPARRADGIRSLAGTVRATTLLEDGEMAHRNAVE